jgi:hypothetical protein
MTDKYQEALDDFVFDAGMGSHYDTVVEALQQSIDIAKGDKVVVDIKPNREKFNLQWHKTHFDGVYTCFEYYKNLVTKEEQK